MRKRKSFSQQSRKETNIFAAPVPSWSFKSRPFSIQQKSQANSQPSEPEDFQTALIRAQRHGHSLSNLAKLSTSPQIQKQEKDSGHNLSHIKPITGLNTLQTVEPIRTGASSNTQPIQMAKRKYPEGTHGFKGSEQKRLRTEEGTQVTGDTHQSEHPIGFEPLNQTSGVRRGTPGRARALENFAPAYQEQLGFHRDHIGTGRHETTRESGFNSRTYRDTQRRLLESNTSEGISSAVQINQLGYAFDPNFRGIANNPTPGSRASDNSFGRMVENMQNVTYASGNQDVSTGVNPWDRAEMLAAREAARTGEWPSQERISELKYWANRQN